ncbi:hypothetical protein BDB00DRAFT_772751 [Zychaea mexicana]|uniref:uncharacterized protein n=1 Tax=Zychaea mexicana TaxID=64656 RepID=UPI0022FE2155|nr:uncharacterized protein BDB00DRAFT_772751 [Zychaea mexicana]KAI9488305.1 hypothetical protein BDB00DRAFT_772751 [Zychaea mexicana]
MIAVSELGDKTFLIAAVMAMKHPRLAVFVGAFSALSLMAILSSYLGHVVPNLLPKQYTDIIAAVLFFFFGIRMTLEARRMKRQEEIQQRHCGNGHDEVEEEESKTELQQYMLPEEGDDDEEEHEEEKKKKRQQQPVLVEAFVLTFLGEWGDKSQISTIALAASNNVYWVASGVIVGHGICTALAVLGGRLIADRISVRTVTMVGAMMFIAFGIVYSHHAYRENSSTCTDIGCV